ncbi:MAG: bifunctional diguanylate cyclase/phosphodiesterase [Lautropia sp.]|nr:bifunctional diguanylate cyclase/phosphodiesterase [Lautropia sp.]
MAQQVKSGKTGGAALRALAVLGIVILLAAPTIYFYYAWHSAEQDMQVQAQEDADFLQEHLRSVPADGVYRDIRHLVQEMPPMSFEGRRLVRDANGGVLGQAGGLSGGAVMVVTLPLRGVAGLRADIDIERSSQPLLWRVLGVGSLMLAFGTLMALVAVQGYRRTRIRPEDAGRVPGLMPLGVLGRDDFLEAVRKTIARSQQNGTECTLFHLDLDHFKMINSAVGRTCADMLLEQIARVMRTRIDVLVHDAGLPPALIGAPGGDVFLVLVEAMPRSAPVTEAFARGVLDALGGAFEVGPYQLYLSASVGASHRAGRAVSAEKLIREAELAKIFAKNQGSGSYAIHDQHMDAEAEARDALSYALRQALAQGEFCLFYQPKVHTVTGMVTGVEALLRWQPPGQPMRMPDSFIPVLEETGLIVSVGAWVLREACCQVMAWRRRGMQAISVAVNVSARQLQQRGFVEMVAQTLQETGLEPRYLELELTETIFVDNAADNVRVLRRLADMGVSLAIDDFGTGHSSLSYLSNFSPRTLKIDRSFLSEAADGTDNIVIARAIIALGHGMGMYVVAEGVETQKQVDFLQGYGCDQMQGYLLSKPLPAEQMERWLQARIHSQQTLEEARRLAVS